MTKFLKSFKYAINGIALALAQRNMRIQLIVAFVVLLMGLYFEIETLEWMLILLIVGNIFTAEIFNSAIEDISDKEKILGLPYKDAGSARDMAAGAVLIQAVVSVAIGMVVFLPKIIEKFF